jgi:hypothetical protein
VPQEQPKTKMALKARLVALRHLVAMQTHLAAELVEVVAM